MDVSSREVLIRLKGAIDPSLRDAFAHVARAAKESERIREQSAKSAAAAESKARKQSTREEEVEVRASMRMAKDRETALQRHYANRAKAARQAANEEARALRQVESAQHRLVKIQEKAIGLVNRFIGAGLNIARGGIMLGLLGDEKDTQRFLQTFIKIQATFDILRGGLQVWKLISQAVRTYNALLAATIAAETALAAAQARRAAAGATANIAGNVGAGAGLAGVAGAAGAGGAGAGVAGAGGISTALLSKVLAGIAAAVSVRAAIASAGLTSYQAGKYGLGKGATPGSLVDIVGGSDWNPFSWLVAWGPKKGAWRAEERTERMTKIAQGMQPQLMAVQAQQAAQEAAMRQQNLDLFYGRINAADYMPSAGTMGLGVMQQAIRGATSSYQAGIRLAEIGRERQLATTLRRRRVQRVGAAENIDVARQARNEAWQRYSAAATNVEMLQRGKGADAATQAQAIQEANQAYQEYMRMREQFAQKDREYTNISLQMQQDKITGLNAELKARENIVRSMEMERKSAMQRFGEESAGTQLRLVSLAERLRGGGKLTKSERQLLDPYATPGTDLYDLIYKEREERAKAGGFKRLLPSFDEITQAETREIQEKLKVEHTMTINISDKANVVQEQFKQAGDRFYKEFMDNFQRWAERQQRKAQEEQNSK